LVRTKQRKGAFRFGTWIIRSLYRAGSLTAAAREFARYKLDLVGVQEVRWNKGDIVRAGIIIVSLEKLTKIINCEQEFCTPQNNINS
jgi:hypothetical protein